MQAPRFTTQPSSSGSMVNEGRTKILQCHALGEFSGQHMEVLLANDRANRNSNFAFNISNRLQLTANET